MPRYSYVWEFCIAPQARAPFESAYGPDGGWVKLFRQAPGYMESLLLHDTANAPRDLTIDRWQSAAAYASFRSRFSAQYAAIDRDCATLTTRETALGEFAEAP